MLNITKNTQLRKTAIRFAAIALIGTSLTACNTLSRLAKMGEEPKLNEIENPTHDPNYQPVSMPMPVPSTAKNTANSLWRLGSRAFLKDLRATQVGDIVTVVISIDDEATIANSTNRTRTTSEDVDIPGLAGFQGALNDVLPEAVTTDNFVNLGSSSTQGGTGNISREEDITLTVAAVVTQVLPNGNLVLHGRQETRVNYEVRELQIAGVIRPQDITNSNTVNYEDIAEARLAYGGRGHISDVQQPRYGSQIIDIILPF
ncbi:flagellar basal body L-ring protein FlgH [Curvivirga aplysinae]|uniref:flagellar basal body L-ring protein FlgH n=1 Tax=Curvivirga aplysinae TaxID=2529852 RepID=UPI0012BBDDFE|nr:flagellar basal body L-ring protein FlgH [Curvivirga aplysinae]MTI10594.1 flagellar basal body L-ring protein FlgH [Curvivirga aplysinae]